MNLICFVILLNSRNFPKTAWLAIHSRQAAHTPFTCLLCFLEAVPGGEALYRQATQACNPFWVLPDELPGGDEFLPGDASRFGLVL